MKKAKLMVFVQKEEVASTLQNDLTDLLVEFVIMSRSAEIQEQKGGRGAGES
jgi:hypothetical protein